MKQPIDLYFKTTNREGFFKDLLSIGLIEITPSCNGLPVSGVTIDYVGKLVQIPATVDTASGVPSVTADPVYYDGEYVNMRLVGAKSEEHETALRAASFANGTTVIEKPENPQRVWA